MNETIDNELQELRKRKLQELMVSRSNKDSGMGGNEYPNKPVTVQDGDFNEFILKYPLVVVDCWAPWCSPCKMLSPIIDNMALKFHGKIVFGKLNVDHNRITAQKYQTMSIPTLLIFRNGKPVDRIMGALPGPVLEQKLHQYLSMGE